MNYIPFCLYLGEFIIMGFFNLIGLTVRKPNSYSVMSLGLMGKGPSGSETGPQLRPLVSNCWQENYSLLWAEGNLSNA